MQAVAVVLLNYNGLHWLKRFLPSVLQRSPESSVYVVDNASTDESLYYLRTHLPKERILQLSSNLGYAAGYNEGLRQVKARYYVLLNTDVCVSEGWLAPLLEFMEANPKAGACQPKLLHHKEAQSLAQHFDYAGAAGGYLDPLGYPYCRGRIFSDIEEDKGQYDEIVRCDWASGACCVLRAEAFWEVGGFDARFFMHMEEIDLCWRLHRAGYGVYCCPRSVVRHVGGGSLPKSSPRKTFLNFRNSLLMLQKQLPWQRLLWLLPLRALLDAAASLYFCSKGEPRLALAVLRAYISFGQQLRPPLKQAKSRSLPYPSYEICIVWAYFVKKRRHFSDLQLPVTFSAALEDN